MSVLSFEQVSISQEGVNTLEDINLTINEGDFYYLIGKTASGKSTFFRSIIAEIGLQSGIASVAGYSLNTIKPSEVPFLRRKLGFVFQDFQLLTDRNVEKNLSFVLEAGILLDWVATMRMQHGMQPLDDRRSEASLLGLCYVQCRVNIGSGFMTSPRIQHSQSVPSCDHRPRETPQIASHGCVG